MFDPFKKLGLEKQFVLNGEELEKSYFSAQKQIHPDRFVGVSEEVKKEVYRQSSEINKAYLSLKDPLQRAAFLLEAEGVELLSHDPAFLEEVMSWNEQIELGEDLTLELGQAEGDLIIHLGDAFENKDYEKARRVLYRLTYLKKILKHLKGRKRS